MQQRLGPLHVRAFGRGDGVVVLLHGLPASGDFYGAGFDAVGAAGCRVVVPDLLGFARSRQASPDGYGLDAQLDALDTMLAALGGEGAELNVAGHSVGGALALHWAARRRSQVRRVVTWNAALFSGREQAVERMLAYSHAARFIGLPSPLARAVCTALCQRRPQAAALLYAACLPRLPLALTRQAVQHTWESYRDVIEDVMFNPGWMGAVAMLEAAAVPMVFAGGGRDRLADPGLRTALAGRRGVVLEVRPEAGHYLPLTDAAWCAQLLR